MMPNPLEPVLFEVKRTIVGQDVLLERMAIAMLAGGHLLVEGVPGLAKTLMVHSLAQSLSLDFNRIQFTPDLMPSDITGTEVLYEDRTSGARELRFVPGPLFANLILADEMAPLDRTIPGASTTSPVAFFPRVAGQSRARVRWAGTAPVTSSCPGGGAAGAAACVEGAGADPFLPGLPGAGAASAFWPAASIAVGLYSFALQEQPVMYSLRYLKAAGRSE